MAEGVSAPSHSPAVFFAYRMNLGRAGRSCSREYRVGIGNRQNHANRTAAERLRAGRAGGLTPLFDSIVFASDYLSQHGDAHAQKVLIVFSDGADTVSRSSLRDSVDAALRAEVQVDCIDLNRSFASSPGATVLREVASATGGRYFPLPNGAAHAINVILEGFQASYTVSYRLPNRDYGFHTVQILPTHDLNLQFRSRSGYYYPDRIR